MSRVIDYESSRIVDSLGHTAVRNTPSSERITRAYDVVLVPQGAASSTCALQEHPAPIERHMMRTPATDGAASGRQSVVFRLSALESAGRAEQREEGDQ